MLISPSFFHPSSKANEWTKSINELGYAVIGKMDVEHFHDIKKLLKALNTLIEQGNTILVIEHNMDMIKCADWVIDIGPAGGDKGGNLVFEGTPEDLAQCKDSITGPFLLEKLA